MSNSSTENSHLISLELSEELKNEEMITRFEKDTRTNCLVLSLNHNYKKKCFIFPIPTKRIDWSAIIDMIAKALKAFGMSPGHMLMIEDVVQVNYEIVIRVADTSDQQNPENSKKKEIYYVRKYTANNSLPLHESVVFTDTGQSTFVYLDNDGKLRFIDRIERPDKVLYPADNMDSQNPLPYTFASPEELQKYIDLARPETLDSLYQFVKSNFRRYVNVDEHYLVMLASDVILSYFQEKFPTMHLDIFVGDNGSGKNSAQSVISRLGYRVYSLVSASAPNYFTAYGSVEEGQVTIAEDEVTDLDKDYQKQKILKSGYAFGGTVPKTDFPNGKRNQILFNVFGIKWLAMEELPDSKNTRGIYDRSLIIHFVAGGVDYNIKDVIRNAGDSKYKPLYDELVHLHKLLFAFRLIHYNDVFPDVEINLVNRNAELTKPSLRLFLSQGNAPIAVEELRLALSKFVQEKNALKSNSIESKLCVVINELVKDRDKNPNSEEYSGLNDFAFTNEQIWNKCRLIMDGIDIWGKSESFYSSEFGKVIHRQISSLLQSKFKGKPFKTNGNNSKRGWQFDKENLDRITLQYTNNPEEIIILTRTAKDPLEFDLSLHYLEKHKPNLIKLPIGKASMDDRADHAVELSKKRLSESFVYDDEDYEI